eukprot:TRINITY_DN285_c0_g1_i3.p1 TRINITY_DN285_c0_g1~~TRINITY_DN285_c0_g1_i3.p1  ORF type:complete len:220 (+),score=11.69 TRINITY_DN285_c0_g1_i3:303-962(+)
MQESIQENKKTARLGYKTTPHPPMPKTGLRQHLPPRLGRQHARSDQREHRPPKRRRPLKSRRRLRRVGHPHRHGPDGKRGGGRRPGSPKTTFSEPPDVSSSKAASRRKKRETHEATNSQMPRSEQSLAFSQSSAIKPRTKNEPSAAAQAAPKKPARPMGAAGGVGGAPAPAPHLGSALRRGDHGRGGPNGGGDGVLPFPLRAAAENCRAGWGPGQLPPL